MAVISTIPIYINGMMHFILDTDGFFRYNHIEFIYKFTEERSGGFFAYPFSGLITKSWCLFEVASSSEIIESSTFNAGRRENNVESLLGRFER